VLVERRGGRAQGNWIHGERGGLRRLHSWQEGASGPAPPSSGHLLIVQKNVLDDEKNQDEDLIMKQHKFHFTTWLKDINLPVGKTKEEKMTHLLTSDPHSLVKSWQAYDINRCTFYTKAMNSRSQCQNSGESRCKR
jgi:hypothetical protein